MRTSRDMISYYAAQARWRRRLRWLLRSRLGEHFMKAVARARKRFAEG
jgi:ABC-type uncharacterized transport system auxiliary subunit